MPRRLLNFGILLFVVFAGCWLTLPIWRIWYSALQRKDAGSSPVAFRDVREEDIIRRSVSDMFRGHFRTIHISFLPSFVNTDLTDRDINDQIKLLADYSPPPSDVLLPLWTRERISEAYKLFLSDYFIAEEARLNLDEQSVQRLNDLVGKYRKERTKLINISSRSPQKATTIREAISRVISTHFRTEAEFLQIIEAFSQIPDTENEELPHTRFSSINDQWINGKDLNCRERFQGLGRFSVHDASGESHVDLPILMFGADYKFLPFIPPSWFNIELLRNGKKSVALANIQNALYFGPDGYLERIPLGLVARKLQTVEFQVPLDRLSELNELLKGNGQFSLSVNGSYFLLSPEDLKRLVLTGIAKLDVSPPRIKVAAVASEVL